MGLEETRMDALGGERGAQMDDTCGRTSTEQAGRHEGDKSNWTKASHSATLVKNRRVLGEAELDKKKTS